MYTIHAQIQFGLILRATILFPILALVYDTRNRGPVVCLRSRRSSNKILTNLCPLAYPSVENQNLE